MTPSRARSSVEEKYFGKFNIVDFEVKGMHRGIFPDRGWGKATGRG